MRALTERLAVEAVPAPPYARDNVRTGFLEDGQLAKLVKLPPRVLVSCHGGGRQDVWSWGKHGIVGMRSLLAGLIPAPLRSWTPAGCPGGNAVYALLRECAHRKEPNGFVFTRSNGKCVRNFRKLWANAASLPAALGCCIFAAGSLAVSSSATTSLPRPTSRTQSRSSAALQDTSPLL
jgi:hypothetical protein